jgi:hypothetical protein
VPIKIYRKGCNICGIAGYIGESKNPQLTYDLITALFQGVETRGKDAAGFWGVNNEQVIFHKEPGRSSQLIKKNEWLDILNFNPSLLITHAREASSGVGPPAINKNNHPFTSRDKNIALIHNGRVAEADYRNLLKKYEVATACDSEILLRIFENSPGLDGIKDIWAFSQKTQMAVAIAERAEDNRHRLWLFRNQHRSLWIIDLQDILGQTFFCSTAEIWHNALKSHKIKELLNKRIKLIELTPEEVWSFELGSDLKRFAVERAGATAWELDRVPIKDGKPVGLITGLNGEEEPKNKPPSAIIESSSLKRIIEAAQAVRLKAVAVASTDEKKFSVLNEIKTEALISELESAQQTLEEVLLILS